VDAGITLEADLAVTTGSRGRCLEAVAR